jgi:hypothetical protein
MKSGRKGFVLMIILIMAISAGFSPAYAQGNSAAASASSGVAPIVTSDSSVLIAHHHWQGFLELAALANGTVGVKDLEHAFGLKATYQSGLGSHDFYKIQDFVTLSLHGDQAALSAYPNRASTLVIFDLPDARDPRACITPSQAINDVQSAGWRLRKRSPAEPSRGDVKEIMPVDAPYGSYVFTKGDQGVLLLSYSGKTNCAKKAIMSSDKLEFNRINQVNVRRVGYSVQTVEAAAVVRMPLRQSSSFKGSEVLDSFAFLDEFTSMSREGNGCFAQRET